MGNCLGQKQVYSSDDTKGKAKWKNFLSGSEAYQKYAKDGSLPKNCSKSMLELRAFLDDGDLTASIGLFARSLKISLDWESWYSTWIDIMEYKAIDEECTDYQRSKATLILEKHLKVWSSTEKECEIAHINEVLGSPSPALPSNLFDAILIHTLENIHTHIFVSFRQTEAYLKVIDRVKSSHSINADDFDYMEKLGQGGFGVVIHGRKKSTGLHYAIKVQSKQGMVKVFKQRHYRVLDERNAMVLCVHPFIIGLEYAFQTPTLAVMAMELGTAGTLHDALDIMPDNKMPLERVKFYTAEIVLALSHLHRLGLIYRDLKPSNVLLMASGHIKLVDLGGIIDPKEKLLKETAMNFADESLFVADRVEVPESSSSGSSGRTLRGNNLNSSSSSHRVLSVMGTKGYMAPEMKRDNTGYTCAIDWWSFGVTLFVLLHGRKPHEQEVPTDEGYVHSQDSPRKGHEKLSLTQTGVLQSEASAVLGEFMEHNYADDAYVMYFQTANNTKVGPDTINFISTLLLVDPKIRLGSGAEGSRRIKQHEFFKEIDWISMEKLQHSPPFLPKVVPTQDVNSYESFDEMTNTLCRDKIYSEEPAAVGAKFFKKWDYISPQAVQKEVYIMSMLE